MPGGFKYPSSSDIDPNVVDLLYRAIKPKLDSLIDDRQQRRQVWGPTFKQEGIRVLPIADADYVVPAPEYGKRTLIFTGALTAERRVELPALAGAWWIIRNDTAGAIKTVAGADGVTGPVIPIGESAAVYTDGHVVWTFPTVAVGGGGGGTGALPDGIDTELQARAGPTTFKRVTYSITSDQHVSLAGQFTVTLPPPLHTEARIVIECTAQHPKMTFTKYLTGIEPILIEFNKAGGTSALPVEVADGEWVGALRFRGWGGSPAAFNLYGYLDVRRIEPQGAVTILGAGALGRANVGISDNGTVASAGLYAAALPSGSHYFQVQTYGHVISGGTTGSIWFKAEPSGGIAYYIPLDINPALDNGKVLTVVETGPSTGVYLPKWMPPPGGSGGGAPGLPDWSLQYRQNATTFGGVTSSIVTGANIVLGGELAFHNVVSTDQHVRISALGTDPAILMAKFAIAGAPTFFFRKGRGTHALPEAVSDGDTIGGILFQGHDGTAEWPVNGYLRVFLDPMPDYSGNIVELGAGNFDEALVRVTNNGTVGSAGLYAAAWLWQVQTGGLVSSFGQTGSMLYKAPGGAGTPSIGYMWDLPIGEEGQVLTVAESTHPTFGDYLHPKWAAPSTGALPEGDFHELQSRWDATTFKRVLNSEVTGANIKLAGNLALSDTLDHRIDFRRTTTPGASDYVGSIWFQVAGHLPDDNVAVLRCLNTSAGYVADFALAAANRLYIGEDATGLEWSPTRYIQFQSEGIRLSGGALGSIFYQETHGGANLYFDPLLIGAANTYLKSDGTRPVWAILPAGTVTSPGGSVPQLQFHQTGGIFGGITGSSTDGTNVWLTGFLNVNQQVILNEAPAYVTFRGDAGATIYGFIRGFGTVGNGVMEIACGESGVGPRVEVQQIGTTALLAGTNFFRVHTDGTLLAIGERGSLYFKGDLDYLVPLDILGTAGAPVYLKATGDLPFWATLGWGDISGVLPISKGGTGTGTAPGPGYLLIGKADGSYVPAILTEDTGILITEGDGTITIKCTVTPGTGATPPGGSQTQIQFHNTSDEFGGVAGSLVDTFGNITLGGNTTVTSTGERELLFNRTTPANTVDGALLGQVAFKDSTTGAGTAKGVFRSYWTTAYSAGYTLEMWAADDRRLHISQVAATMEFLGQSVQLQSGGVAISVGTTGGELYYRSGTGFITFVPVTSATNKWLRFNGSIPTWQAISAGSNVTISEVGGGIQISASGGPGGAVPGGSQGQIQYNDSSTFAGIGNYTSSSFEVAPANGPPNLVLAGGFFQIVPSISGTIPTRNPNQDQEFFISATMAAPTRFVMRRYSNQPNDSSSIDGRLGGYIRFDKGRGTAAIPEDIANGDQMGQITWWGRTGGALAQMGHIVTYFNAGGVLRLAAKAGGYTFIDIREGTVPATDNSITLYAANQVHYIQVQQGGIRLSIGAHGSILWQDNSSGAVYVAALPISTNNTHVLRSDGAKPYWGVSPGGGALSPPVTLTYSTATDNDPTFFVNHTQSGASALAFGMKVQFTHSHASNVSNGRRSLAVLWDQTANGLSTSGDAIFNVYGQNAVGLSLGSYNLTGILIDSAFSTVVGTFTGLRIKAPNATTIKAIVVDPLAGSVVIGGDVTSATQGYLFIPTCNGTPSVNIASGFPTSTCALVFDRTNNKLYGNDTGSAWIDLTPSGSASAGGSTYSIQYNTGSGFGGIGPSAGGLVITGSPPTVLAAGSSGQYLRSSGAAAPSWSFLTAGDLTGTSPVALIRGGTGSSLSAPGGNRILYYDSSAGVVTWLNIDSTLSINTSTDTLSAVGGSAAAPLTLTLTSTTNNPTLTIDHTQSGSGTITDVYGERFYFRHSHSGAVSGAGGRKGVSMIWDHTNSGSGTVSTDGDILLQLFAQNTGSLSTSSYKFTALTIDAYLPANYGTFTGIRIKGFNATTRRAIVCDYGSGDVVINSGTDLTASATWGFLYIPAMTTQPNSGSINSIVPLGTCGIVWDKANNRLCFNDGDGWRYVNMTGSF